MTSWACVVLTWIAILNEGKVQASDGCGTDNWRCGDKCVPQSKPCHCGETQIHFDLAWHQEWCCSDEPCTGLGLEEPTDKETHNAFSNPILSNGWQKYGLAWSEGVNCSSGNVLHFSQPCKGKCNDNRKDLIKDDRSYIPCAPVTKNASISQCIRQADENNNQFSCLNRADENPFSPQGSDFIFVTSGGQIFLKV